MQGFQTPPVLPQRPSPSPRRSAPACPQTSDIAPPPQTPSPAHARRFQTARCRLPSTAHPREPPDARSIQISIHPWARLFLDRAAATSPRPLAILHTQPCATTSRGVPFRSSPHIRKLARSTSPPPP